MSEGNGGGSNEPRKGSRLRAGLLGMIAVLYLLSVPWYRADDQPLRLLFGLPDWVAVAVLGWGWPRSGDQGVAERSPNIL